jgi:hypothetical protein
MTYEGMVKALHGRPVKKLGNNTYGIQRDGFIEVTLHGHTIIRWYPASDVQPAHCTLHTCGWQTNTTKERFNTWSPIQVWQEKFVWYYIYPPTSIWGHDEFVNNGTYYETVDAY